MQRYDCKVLTLKGKNNTWKFKVKKSPYKYNVFNGKTLDEEGIMTENPLIFARPHKFPPVQIVYFSK